ncbi:hypothetical protein NSQ91_17625 [Paenibacillus sp. FSL R7-0048]|uniref:hypothetical protein n=1 Tax=Paenibacillus TaxID=44249 RepID=UPI00096CA4EE|nr:hypothetical protein [Paenibacillus odorifer]OMC67753.1 hypothetical protein BK125_28550 [Paenibacillus odorifer]OMD72466.1 hypothetical protein BSK48_08515 [Paenibacillus odorifer]OMD86597.1 hypothetical protein BSK53_04025 [Paenibacillus odorifer]
MIKLLELGLATSLLLTPAASATSFGDSTTTQNSTVSTVTPVSEVSTVSPFSENTDVIHFGEYTFENNIIEGPGTRLQVGNGIEPPLVSLFSEAYKIIPVSHTGGAFNDSFTCTASDGVNLNIWMKNKSSNPVQFQIKLNGSVFTDVKIAAGEQKTISFKDMLGGGITDTFGVYIYSTTGHALNVDVSARQF